MWKWTPDQAQSGVIIETRLPESLRRSLAQVLIQLELHAGFLIGIST